MEHQNDDSSTVQRHLTPPNQSSGAAVQRKATPQLQSTPRKSGTPRSTSNVTDHRSVIIDYMKDEIVRCDTWEGGGFNHYLPDVGITEDDIGAAITKLKGDGLLQIINSEQERFKKFDTNPAKMRTTEIECYTPLVEICNVLGKLRLKSGRAASCELFQKPFHYNSAETNGGNFKVDAYLKLLHSTVPASDPPPQQIPLADLAVPSEYKKESGDTAKNRGQLVGAATFCMKDDPRRMHIYGITIEDSKMTVWYFSRSHSAKSPEFDFTMDPRTYIRVMLSLLFATEEELGYDPTVERHLDSGVNTENKELCFVYKVKGKIQGKDRYFKTQGVIFDQRSVCLTGRGTRVWKVVEVASFQKLQPINDLTMVLKDGWLDSESKTEGQNLDAVFEQLEEISQRLEKGGELKVLDDFHDEDSKNKLKECLEARSWGQYFLTRVCDCQGSESKKVPEAAQPDSTLFDPPPPTVKPASLPHSNRSRATAHLPTDQAPVPAKRPTRSYCPKRQYRVVFEELCEALHDVQQLRDVATALRDSVFALQLMFLANWVHRDISSGNVYAFNNGSEVRGILGDLEYAKPFDPKGATGTSDPKTGTAYFMAVEIHNQSLIHEINKPTEKPKAGEDMEQETPDPIIIHNFEHDLESIFWLLLWTLLACFPPERSAEKKVEFQGVLSPIFRNASTPTTDREHILVREGKLKNLLGWLNPELESLAKSLEKLRRALVAGYQARAYNFDDMASYAWLYFFFREALDQTKALDVARGPTDDPQTDRPTRVKRKRNIKVGEENEPSSPKAARGAGSTDAASLRTPNPDVPEPEGGSPSTKAL